MDVGRVRTPACPVSDRPGYSRSLFRPTSEGGCLHPGGCFIHGTGTKVTGRSRRDCRSYTLTHMEVSMDKWPPGVSTRVL